MESGIIWPLIKLVLVIFVVRVGNMIQFLTPVLVGVAGEKALSVGMHMTERPGWSQWYLEIAQKIAERSVCLHRHVGAILVREHQIISAGYSGPLSGHDHCSALGGCAREGVLSGQRIELCRGAHAEQNAINFAARFGNAVKGASLYTSHFPCSWCAKSIIPAGIVEVIYGADYPDPLAKKLLDDSGIVVRKVSE